jgi:hypothetical protein
MNKRPFFIAVVCVIDDDGGCALRSSSVTLREMPFHSREWMPFDRSRRAIACFDWSASIVCEP